ncbi:MazG nucleotide pyrophosphohydrolase domain-containing protein [Maritalea mediterranea]|uniref:Phosphoribosyl-ATP pyrophosphohydrolase n=1 Tax=Maritalea mediterranea TaxID=2909667 RepID=A0ABS9EBU7_9HYPH|nr:MazG nucleotide pyrophosphohydrolase domain-containing protein [Maritalea mediterranea]MCF4098898.1 phosphoribosyl-ATP pyrophosphohydrolase [Maritalea mediterranea]
MNAETLDRLTDKISRVSDTYAERCNIARDDDWYLLKLNEELGELTAAYLRMTQRGRFDAARTPENARASMEAEVADVFAQLLLFVQHNGIDIEDAVTRKWFKYLPQDEQ